MIQASNSTICFNLFISGPGFTRVIIPLALFMSVITVLICFISHFLSLPHTFIRQRSRSVSAAGYSLISFITRCLISSMHTIYMAKIYFNIRNYFVCSFQQNRFKLHSLTIKYTVPSYPHTI